jgi:hypothetical protein
MAPHVVSRPPTGSENFFLEYDMVHALPVLVRSLIACQKQLGGWESWWVGRTRHVPLDVAYYILYMLSTGI